MQIKNSIDYKNQSKRIEILESELRLRELHLKN